MQSNNKKKICIVTLSLGIGGAERSAAFLSQMLHGLGYEVHVVSVLNKIVYNYEGELLNLGLLKEKNDSIFGRFLRLFKFKQYLKTHNFDFIIDNRPRHDAIKELIISKIIYKSIKTIYIVHSFSLGTYFPKNKFVSKIIYRNASKIVAVSKEIKALVKNTYGLDNVETIYNAINIASVEEKAAKAIVVQEKYILFYGRLINEVKNISFLIDAYHASKLKENNIKLYIVGDGADKNKLVDKVSALLLTDWVVFKPFTNNPFVYLKNALFSVLTSKYEGFPMVLLESLALKTPVVSVNCSSGPKEIINHKLNGLLVNDYTVKAFADAMDSFIFDHTLYQRCKENSKPSIEKFSIENIAIDWEKLLNNII